MFLLLRFFFVPAATPPILTLSTRRFCFLILEAGFLFFHFQQYLPFSSLLFTILPNMSSIKNTLLLAFVALNCNPPPSIFSHWLPTPF